MHIDKVDNDDAAHITQTQLSCKLIGSSEVHIECVLLLSVLCTCPVPAVDIHNMHGLSMLDDEVGSVLIVDCLPESGFQLFRDVEVVEYRNLALIEFHYTLLAWCYERYVLAYLFVNTAVIDMYCRVCRVKEVAQQCHGTACLLINELWPFLRVVNSLEHILPFLHQESHFCLQLFSLASFCHGAYYHTDILGLHALYYLFQTGAFGAALNLC